MNSETRVLNCRSERAPQFVDITEDVTRTVAGTPIRNGLVTVYSQDATTAIKINEHEPLLLEDLERMLSESTSGRLAGTANGSAANGGQNTRRIQPRGLLSSSETIPLVDGCLLF